MSLAAFLSVLYLCELPVLIPACRHPKRVFTEGKDGHDNWALTSYRLSALSPIHENMFSMAAAVQYVQFSVGFFIF